MSGPPTRQPQRPDFTTLVTTLTSDVWLLCRRLGDPTSADDLTQETFLRVYQALPGFRHTASPRTWVLAIARRVCADHVRRAQRGRALASRVQQHVSTGTDGGDPSSEVTLWRLIDALPFERRTAFVLTQVFGLSYLEAAEVCECPVGTIRSRVARARSDLIEAYEPAGHDRRHA